MATYFVDGDVGLDTNAGTSAGAGNAWLTLSKALTVATALADVVNVKARASAGVYSISTGLTGAAATFSGRVRFVGYTTTVGDGGQVTVQTSAAVAGLTLSGYNYIFENFTFDGNSVGTVGVTVSGSFGNTLVNCIVKNWTAEGVKVTGAIPFSMLGGEVTNCHGTNGAMDLISDPGLVSGVKVHGNAGVGIYVASHVSVRGCRIYANGSHGCNYNSFPVVFCANTVHGNAGDGLRFGTYHIVNELYNNIFTSNTGFGVNSPNLASAAVDAAVDYNWYGTGGLANTSGRHNSTLNGGTAGLGPHEAAGDPSYANAAAGDFTPGNALVQAGSP